jgi:hypothetical protein
MATMPANSHLNGEARFSPCQRYRYVLTRWWGGTRSIAFVLLNPSTATAHQDDPTIRRCIAFARQWDYERLIVLNLFARRTAQPRDLLQADDPIGPDNDRTIQEFAASVDCVVAGWGVNGAFARRDQDVLRLLPKKLHCLRLTKAGFPAHPLYLPASTLPMAWQPQRDAPAGQGVSAARP